MLIGDTQCDLCKHKTDNNYGCVKFGKAPQEVLKNEFRCKEFKSKTASYPWDEE